MLLERPWFVLFDPSCPCGGRLIGRLVGRLVRRRRLVGQSVIISHKGSKLPFHAPIGALVLFSKCTFVQHVPGVHKPYPWEYWPLEQVLGYDQHCGQSWQLLTQGFSYF